MTGHRSVPWEPVLCGFIGLLIIVGPTVSQSQECNQPLGVGSGDVKTEQLKSSPVRADLNVEYGRYNCCMDQTFAAWCPANLTEENWYEVSFDGPRNVTGLRVQVPVNNASTHDPYLTEFSVLLEHASGELGSLQLLELPGNVSTFQTSLTENETEFTWPGQLVRRVRVKVMNYTSEPCFRLQVIGCPIDAVSENVVPVNIRAPKLQFVYSDVSSMSMECSVQDASVYGVQYWVTWSVNGQQRSRKLMGPGVYSSTLPLSTQDFNSLSSKIECSLEACYAADCNNATSTIITSPAFRPEVIVTSSKTLTVREGGPRGEVRIQATVPPSLFCLAAGRERDCTVAVKASVESLERNPPTCSQGVEPAQVVFPETEGSTDSCNIKLTETNWRSEIRIPIQAALDGIMDGNQRVRVSLTNRIDTLTDINTVKTVEVLVEDSDKGDHCSLLSLGHLNSFDNTAYNTHQPGEFILYRHTQYPIQVNVFVNDCGADLLCTCAVSVRVGDDVIRVGNCEGSLSSQRPLLKQLFYAVPVNKDFRVVSENSGDSITIVIPTGAFLNVRVANENSLDIWLYPSLQDFNMTEGLCGSYDGSMQDDLVLRNGSVYTGSGSKYLQDFTTDWRVSAEESLYTGVCPGPNVSRGLPEREVCDCSGNDACAVWNLNRDCLAYQDYYAGEDYTDQMFRAGIYAKNCRPNITIPRFMQINFVPQQNYQNGCMYIESEDLLCIYIY